jgi:hypothetical protein
VCACVGTSERACVFACLCLHLSVCVAFSLIHTDTHIHTYTYTRSVCVCVCVSLGVLERRKEQAGYLYRLDQETRGLQRHHAVLAVPGHVLEVVGEEAGESAGLQEAVPAARVAALFNPCRGVPGADRLRAMPTHPSANSTHALPTTMFGKRPIIQTRIHRKSQFAITSRSLIFSSRLFGLKMS